MPTAVAIRHVCFEDLGSFAAVLSARGTFDVAYLDAGVDDLASLWTAALPSALGRWRMGEGSPGDRIGTEPAVLA